jgi:hypothetical protein
VIGLVLVYPWNAQLWYNNYMEGTCGGWVAGQGLLKTNNEHALTFS